MNQLPMTKEQLQMEAAKALTMMHLRSANTDVLGTVKELMKRSQPQVNEIGAIMIESFKETETGDDIYDVEYGMTIFGDNVFASLLHVSEQQPSLRFFALGYAHIWVVEELDG